MIFSAPNVSVHELIFKNSLAVLRDRKVSITVENAMSQMWN